MAFEEIQKTPTMREISNLKRRYRKLNDKYNQLRADFSYHIACEDFSLVSVSDFLDLKEIFIEKRQLYWEIFKLEHPEDKATVEAYMFLNGLSFDEKTEFLQSHGLTTHDLINEIKKNPNYLDEVTA